MGKRRPHSPTKRELLAENARLRERVEALEAIVAELKAELAKARNDSSTSSNPPSSDIVKPPKPPVPKGTAKRKRGGQPGHPRHERPAFPPDMVNVVHDYTLEVCPDCACADLQLSKREPLILARPAPATPRAW